MSSPIFLIDSSIYIFRSYFGRENLCWSEGGKPTGAVLGYAQFLLRLLLQQRPLRLAATFDESLFTGFRHQLYPDYKANRALPDADLAFQLDACVQVALSLGIASFASKTYEADDLLASLTRFVLEKRQSVCILTRDRDLQQLLADRVIIRGDVAGPDSEQVISRSEFIEARGIKPEQLPLWQALVGDPGDNIPGVPGIGAKSATQLVRHFDNLQEILSRPEDAARLPIRGSASLPPKLQLYGDQLRLMHRLTTLVDTVPLLNRIEELDRQPVVTATARSLCDKLGLTAVAGFRRFLDRWEQDVS